MKARLACRMTRVGAVAIKRVDVWNDLFCTPDILPLIVNGLQEVQILRIVNGGNRGQSGIIGGMKIKTQTRNRTAQDFRALRDFGDRLFLARDNECLAVMA